MILILFILICFGFTNIIVNGEIFEYIRSFIEKKSTFFGKLINCSMCFGFWIGIGVAFFINPLETYTTFWLSVVGCAVISSATSYILDTIMYKIEK